MMERVDGSWRVEKAVGDKDNVMVLTPMSQPVGERLTFPPIARPSIWIISKHNELLIINFFIKLGKMW